MHGFRHNRCLSNEAKTLQLIDQLADTCSRQKLVHEAAEAKRDNWNSERWEQRAKGKLSKVKEELREAKVKVEDAEMVAQITLDENMLLHR
jgi:hypothetical protein